MTEAEFNDLILKLIKNDPNVTKVTFGPSDRPGEDPDPALFDTQHAIYLCNALAFNTHCKELMFRNVQLGMEGAASINHLVKTNTGLRMLRLFNVGFDHQFVILGIDGIKLILDAFKGIKHPNLKTLKISDKCYNPVDNDKLIDAFSDMLKENTTLTSVYFNGCRITLDAFKRLCNVVRNDNTKIFSIIYDENDLCYPNNNQSPKADPAYLQEKEKLENASSRNAYFRTVRQLAVIMAQASRDEDCDLKKKFPNEMLVKIAELVSQPDYYFNRFSLFSNEEQDGIEKMAAKEAIRTFAKENSRKA